MLYIFTKSTRSAGGSRHRAFLVADFLRTAGYDAFLIIPPIYRTDMSRSQARWEYVKTIFSIRHGDVVFLQNPIFNTYFIILMYIVRILYRPTIVFDFDDATWVQNPIAPRALALIADKFIVASHYLATWSWLGKKPILLISNLVDYTLAEKYQIEQRNNKVVLGWIGGAPDSLPNLKILVPVFKKLAEKKLPIVFKLIGAGGSREVRDLFAQTGIKTEFIDALEWGREGEIQKANGSFDIGLCPLVDNESNRGRCSLKVLDYMAAGIPVVISPVGENRYFITNGAEGFLPQTADEWVVDLERLVMDSVLRKEMGIRAKAQLMNKYSYQANLQKYIDFLCLSLKKSSGREQS